MLMPYGLRANDLHVELEVSERMFYSTEQTIEALQRLRDCGVHIAIDDFGTGYSSLSQLKRLPIDTVKIDRSFLHDVSYDSGDQAIATAIISLGHTLGLNVVAEGIETVAQLAFLKAQGCDEGQGFLFSKAVDQEQIQYLIAAA